MATIFNATEIISDINRIVVRDDGEAVGGSEPYLWSVFFKIDGEDENVKATIDVNRFGFSLRLSGNATVESNAGSHGNLNLNGGGVSAPPEVRISVPNAIGRYRSTLFPIPVTINVTDDSWVAETVEDVLLVLDDVLETLTGDRSCPPIPSIGEFLGEFSTELVSGTVGGLPATFGSIYILMEHDWTSDETAEDGRRALRDTLSQELNETIIPSISFTNQSPNDEAMERVEDRVNKLVVDTVFDGINWFFWYFLLGIPGLVFFAGDQDDMLMSTQETMSHSDFSLEQQRTISLNAVAENGNGDWGLRGVIGVDI